MRVNYNLLKIKDMEHEFDLLTTVNIAKHYQGRRQFFQDFCMPHQIVLRHGQDFSTDGKEDITEIGNALTENGIEGVQRTAKILLEFYKQRHICEIAVCFGGNYDEAGQLIFKKRVLETSTIIGDILHSGGLNIKQKVMRQLRYQKYSGKEDDDCFDGMHSAHIIEFMDLLAQDPVNLLITHSNVMSEVLKAAATREGNKHYTGGMRRNNDSSSLSYLRSKDIERIGYLRYPKTIDYASAYRLTGHPISNP